MGELIRKVSNFSAEDCQLGDVAYYLCFRQLIAKWIHPMLIAADQQRVYGTDEGRQRRKRSGNSGLTLSLHC